jgi:hypothetical protein
MTGFGGDTCLEAQWFSGTSGNSSWAIAAEAAKREAATIPGTFHRRLMRGLYDRERH